MKRFQVCYCATRLMVSSFFQKVLKRLITFQTRFAWLILIGSTILAVVSAPGAFKLLGNVKTEILHLLPDHYPSVSYLPHIQKLFNRRNSVAIIITSPDQAANEKAMLDMKDHLLKNDSVESVVFEKSGYDFYNDHKLLLLDLKDLYSIHDRLKDKIQKRKLGGLYIDFEGDGGAEDQDDVSFDDYVDKYKKEFMSGVQSRYVRNDDGTVYVLKVYPKNYDTSLKYYEKYTNQIENYLKDFPITRYHPGMTYGLSGVMVTRVGQYQALMHDLKLAGTISMLSIFAILFLFFSRFTKTFRGVSGFFKTQFVRAVPVIVVFIPMILSTLYAFSFSHLFFKQLNVVTSFLFAIIFGLGVDIGIHMISRYIHDVRANISFEDIRWNVLTRTGLTVIISVLTTVASFYVLVVNDFRGFSEFGWIAGNGLIIALVTYLIVMPSLISLVHRYRLMPLKSLGATHEEIVLRGRRWFTHPKIILGLFIMVSLLSLWGTQDLSFEWDFNKFSIKIPSQVRWGELQRETSGRVNGAATFLLQNGVQAKKIRQVLRERRDHNPHTTLEWFRSFYDMIPFDQGEKLAVLDKIKIMLEDDALNSVKQNERELIDLFKKEIAATKPVTDEDITPGIWQLFSGADNPSVVSAGYIAPLAQLQLMDGTNAKAFYKEGAVVEALGQKFYATSDNIVFADVVQTLFRDSKIAISLCFLVLVILVVAHFRNFKRAIIVLLGLSCGIFWMLGLQDLFGLKLNFYNMIVIPAMIGMGEDNSVHMVDRFDEFGRKSILHVLRTVGGAAFMASATTILGYSGLCFVSHPGLKSIGLMAMLGLGMCLLSSLVLVPVLLQVFVSNRGSSASG